ncbi:MAG: MBL fold metallo-hydrolase [Candidatus Kerfeldbacteria bacterium]|nr:MBL fold metallo-hydrolase [Candidatus Kerfeldbacteria bacterium]
MTITKFGHSCLLIETSGKKILIDPGSYSSVPGGDTVEIGDVTIEALGEKHAVMHPDIPQSDNIGFFIAGRFFYPGDALTNPDGPVEILALPVAGPWLKLSEAIEYAKTVKPKVCFPVHDGILKQPGSVHTLPPRVLESLGIQWKVLDEGAAVEF